MKVGSCIVVSLLLLDLLELDGLVADKDTLQTALASTLAKGSEESCE